MNKVTLPLRTGVGAIVLNKSNMVFVGKRKDNPGKYWQMPQGGVDENENFIEAAKRELEEETGIEKIKLIKQLDEWFIYDLPKNLQGKIWKGKYRGQKQKWFLMKFKGRDNEINLNTIHPEFLDWKWIDIDKITDVVVKFKLDVYKKIQEEVKKILA